MQEWLVEMIIPWLLQMVSGYPWFAVIIAIMGGLRLLMKPLMTLLQVVVKMTPYDKDDKWLASVEAHKGYKAFLYLLDWFASVKGPAPKKKE